jgi:hypothetical protein
MMNEIRLRTSGDDMITAGNNNIVIGNDIKDPIGIILKNYILQQKVVLRVALKSATMRLENSQY